MCHAILKADQSKYVSRQRKRHGVKYGNGLFTPLALLGELGAKAAFGASPNGLPSGSALYIPRSRSGADGQGLGDVISFLLNNASAIKDIAWAVSAGVEIAGKVATTTTDIIRTLRELKTQGMTNTAIEQVIEAGRSKALSFGGPVGAGPEGAGGKWERSALVSDPRGVKAGAWFFYVK